MARHPSPQTLSVIDAFLEEPQLWLYGYDTTKTLGMASGTLYPILIRVSDRGHLETRCGRTQRQPGVHHATCID
jgi:PadR family transcriptional regulator PadR